MNFGFPDICNTIVGPATVPLPYPNLALNTTASPFSPLVKLSMVPAINMGSMIPMTMGDEAGTAHPMVKGPGRYTFGNPIVYIDSLPGIHLLCPTMGNLVNNPLGMVLMPSITSVFFTRAGSLSEEDWRKLDVALEEQTGLVQAVSRYGLAWHLGIVPGDYLIAEAEQVCWRRGDRVHRFVLPGTASSDTASGFSGPFCVLLKGGAGYVSLGEISTGLAGILDTELARMVSCGMSRLILDLRGNMGGDGHEAVRIAGDFLTPGDIISVWRDSDGDMFPYRAASGRLACVRDWPITVWIDRSTASAAEIIAAALQDTGRAMLFGEPSQGKRSAWRADGGGEGGQFLGPGGDIEDAVRPIVPDHVLDCKPDWPSEAELSARLARPQAGEEKWRSDVLHFQAATPGSNGQTKRSKRNVSCL